MYMRVRHTAQNKRNGLITSKVWESKAETPRQRMLRQQADALLERKYGSPHKDHGSINKGFVRAQAKERDRLFFGSHEWFQFRTEILAKRKPYCEACGSARVGVQNVRLIMPLHSHWHLRLNPLNVRIQCLPACRRTRKRERL